MTKIYLFLKEIIVLHLRKRNIRTHHDNLGHIFVLTGRHHWQPELKISAPHIQRNLIISCPSFSTSYTVLDENEICDQT